METFFNNNVKKIKIIPIGIVKNGINDLENRDWENIVSKIVIHPKYVKALDGIEENSHIYVLFYLHKLPKNEMKILKVHPMKRKDLPLVGVFAVRSACRPNPIGLTLVELISRKNNTLIVKGLDAIDGTPIIDIKPFNPKMDKVEKFRIPDWLKKLIEES